MKQLLFGLAAGRCEYRGCNKQLSEDDLTKRRGKFSAFAHIVADEPGGPRGDPVLSPRLAKDLGNLMLLCLDHHRLIDVDDVPGHPVELLQAMKKRHEDRIRRLTEIDDDHRTLLVLMAANIGDRKGVVNPLDARAAVLPLYAVDDGVPIDLAHLRVPDGDGVSWKVGVGEIDEAARRVQEALVRGEAKHVSVFALAPIPLLMHLGRRLGDLAPGEAFQRLRSPPGWEWQPPTGAEPSFDVACLDPAPRSKDVCLVFSVSDDVDADLVARSAPAAAPRYVFRVPEPRTDVVRTRDQVAAFRTRVREFLPRLRAEHGAEVTIHVFPALPNSLAVEFGRVLLPKADPRVEVYDLNRDRGGWVHALTLLPGLTTA
ncbi:MAG: SAVED domain-containing protein [Myxococcota bacterium]